MFQIPFSNGFTQRLNLNDRMMQIRQGSTGFVSPIAPAPQVHLEEASPPDPTGKEIGKKEVTPAFVPSPTNRWGVWINGWGNFASLNDDNGVKGYNYTTGGGTLGIDYRITDCLAIGVFGSGAHSWTDLKPGSVDVNTGLGGVYATYWNQGFWVNGAVYAGANNYDTSRPTLLRGQFANGSTEGYEISTWITTGYDFKFNDLSIGPTFSAQYVNAHVDSFREHASFLPLDLHSDSEESWVTDLGFQAQYAWHVGNITVIPSLYAAWEHQYKVSRLPITFGAADFRGVTATTFSPDIGQNSCIIDAGANVQWTPRISTYIGYHGQVGAKNYEANGVSGTFSFSF
jgi:outer membrane lipase/esterase